MCITPVPATTLCQLCTRGPTRASPAQAGDQLFQEIAAQPLGRAPAARRANDVELRGREGGADRLERADGGLVLVGGGGETTRRARRARLPAHHDVAGGGNPALHEGSRTG